MICLHTLPTIKFRESQALQCGNFHLHAERKYPYIHAMIFPPSTEFNPFDRTILADPYPILNNLRASDPVHWNPIIDKWMILRFDDFMQLCRNQRLSSKPRSTTSAPKILRSGPRPRRSENRTRNLCPSFPKSIFSEAKNNLAQRGLSSRLKEP